MSLKMLRKVEVYFGYSDVKSSRGICIVVPDSIRTTFACGGYQAIACRIRRHFGSDKKLLQDISQDLEVKLLEVDKPKDEWVLWLKETPVATDFGVREGEYLEVFLDKMIPRVKEGSPPRPSVSIFSAKDVEEYDFVAPQL